MLKLRSLQTRIVVPFMLLMLFVQLAGLVVSQTTITKNARASVGEQLVAGEKVFRHLLAQNGQQLVLAARVLAADYGFREALATDDRETIDSALRNHSARMDAGIALLVSLDRHVRAGTSSVEAVGAAFRYPELVARAEEQGTATGMAMLGGRLYELVVVPVRAPVPIAWVVMGFAVDGVLATQLQNLANLQVTFLASGESNAWSLIATTLPGSSGSELLADLPRVPPADGITFETSLDGDKYVTLVATLWRAGDQIAVAVLQRSIGQAIAPYLHLQLTLLILTLVGLAVSAVGSVVTARSVTRPVKALVAFAKRLERGDYSESLEIRQRDEIGELASAFNHMREGIAVREHKITTLAYRDPLTGLANRVQFAQTLAQALVAAREGNAPLAVMILDLDRFKYVNDVLGHHLGDLLLREVASRLQNTLLRRSDTVARLGGDEFAVLIRCEPMDNVLAIAQRLLGALEKPIVLDGQVIDVGASIGIAVYPEDGSDVNTLLSRADVAMYAAKRNRGCALAYDSKFDQNNQENLSLMGDLRQAVANNELTLHYQPKIDLATGVVRGVEVLLRWNHPKRGCVPPDRFIPYAEQTGYIKVITQWVLDRAFAQSAQWRRRGLNLTMAVNLSARDLVDPGLTDRIAELLRVHRVDPKSVYLEITESAIMDDPANAQATLERLNQMGLRLSIDDFGTGYSSLAYLKRLPVHELKIDKSFVMDMVTDRDDAIIVRSTVDLGHNMNLQVVAEGIESVEIWELLANLGCDYGQGFHMSKALPAEEFEAWLARWPAEGPRRQRRPQLVSVV